MGHRAPVQRVIQNCSVCFQGVCPNNSVRLPIHGRDTLAVVLHVGFTGGQQQVIIHLARRRIAILIQHILLIAVRELCLLLLERGMRQQCLRWSGLYMPTSHSKRTISKQQPYNTAPVCSGSSKSIRQYGWCSS